MVWSLSIGENLFRYLGQKTNFIRRKLLFFVYHCSFESLITILLKTSHISWKYVSGLFLTLHIYYFCCSKLFFIYLLISYFLIGIQQENRHIRQLQHENKELRAALEEHQNVLELIMSKYREHMSCFQNSTKIEKDLVTRENTKVRSLISKSIKNYLS